MGVTFRLQVYAADEPAARAAAGAAFARVTELEQATDPARSDGELTRLCDGAGGPPRKLSDDLFLILQQAQLVAKRGDGALDVTAAPYAALWREACASGELPPEQALTAAAPLVGWRKLRLDPIERTAVLLLPGMKLDVGALAPGYAADCALATLRRHGVDRARVDAGPTLAVSAPPPGAKGWRVNLPDPSAGPGRTRALDLADAAISSAGDNNDRVTVGGREYWRLLDPFTGVGVADRPAVTVVARSGIATQSLCAAAAVLGRESGLPLVRSWPGAGTIFHEPSRAGL